MVCRLLNTSDIPPAATNPDLLNSLNDLKTLSFCLAPISLSSAAFFTPSLNTANAAPATLAAIPKPGINIKAAPISFPAVEIDSANVVTAFAPTSAPRSPSCNAFVICKVPLTNPLAAVAKASNPIAVLGLVFARCCNPASQPLAFTLLIAELNVSRFFISSFVKLFFFCSSASDWLALDF